MKRPVQTDESKLDDSEESHTWEDDLLQDDQVGLRTVH